MAFQDTFFKKPMKGIRNKRAKATLNKPIDNVAELLDEIKNYNANLYLCCLLTYGCLLRPHREVRELTWGDFSKDLSTVRLSGSRNKSGRNRVVPVPSYIREVLRPSIPEHNLFTGDLRAPNPDYFNLLGADSRSALNSLKMVKRYTLLDIQELLIYTSVHAQ